MADRSAFPGSPPVLEVLVSIMNFITFIALALLFPVVK
jgi:hypothetical protein